MAENELKSTKDQHNAEIEEKSKKHGDWIILYSVVRTYVRTYVHNIHTYIAVRTYAHYFHDTILAQVRLRACF